MRLVLCLFCLLTFSLSLAIENYYPDRDGLSWTYSNGERQALSGPREVNGQQVMVLTHYVQGVPISEDYLQFGGDGVRTYGTASGGQILPYAPYLFVYPASPLQVGQTWSSQARVANFDITLSAQVLGVLGVETASGRFNALQIRQSTVTSTGAQTVIDVYFVPSIGVVRWVMQDGTVIDLIEKNF